MALPNLSLLEVINNINAASIDAVYIKIGSEKWQTVGYITNASINVALQSSTTSLGEAISNNSLHIKVSFDMLETEASTVLPLIESMIGNQCSWLVKTVASDMTTGSGWINLPSTAVGAKITYNNDGDITKTSVISVELSGSITLSSLDSLWNTTLTVESFETSSESGTFHALGDYTSGVVGGAGNMSLIVPAGLKEIQYTSYGTGGDATSIQNLGGTALKIEYNVIEAPDKRYIATNSASVTIDIDWVYASESVVTQLDALVGQLVAVEATCYDNSALSFGRLGITVTVDNADDVKKSRLVKLHNTGTIILNQIRVVGT
jgi:hypothetical protein